MPISLRFNDILKAFKTKFKDPIPTEIFKLPNGFLITAPKTLNGIDYSDPYYFVSSDLSEVRILYSNERADMFKAFVDGPIWKKD